MTTPHSPARSLVKTDALERPPEPTGTDSVWYCDWECGYDDEAAKWVPEPWRAYRGGCDLDAPQISAKSWTGLLDEIDAEEGE